MNRCPVTCPCRRGGEGAFLLALCAWAAMWSPVFLGVNFSGLIVAFVRAPQNPPLALIVWTVLVAAGLALIGTGFRAAFRSGDMPPVGSSVVVAASAALALLCGWQPANWAITFKGIYVGLVAGGIANLCLAACARFWLEGYVAAESGRGVPLLRRSQAMIERQAQEISALTAERDRLAHEVARAPALPHDVEALLRSPDVRRAVLATTHPDRAKSDADRRERTERFQMVSAIFERIGAR